MSDDNHRNEVPLLSRRDMLAIAYVVLAMAVTGGITVAIAALIKWVMSS